MTTLEILRSFFSNIYVHILKETVITLHSKLCKENMYTWLIIVHTVYIYSVWTYCVFKKYYIKKIYIILSN